jgi:uncharacterized membrane protein
MAARLTADLRPQGEAASQRSGSIGGTTVQALIWTGAALSLGGIAGLIYCVLRAMRARRAGLEDAAMRAELQRVVVVNMAALGVSALGLMLVVAGIVLS